MCANYCVSTLGGCKAGSTLGDGTGILGYFEVEDFHSESVVAFVGMVKF